MFPKSALDEMGEIPSPHWEEKYNFNPHDVKGQFDKSDDGTPLIKKDGDGKAVDNFGKHVNDKGLLVDDDGNVINKYTWK